MAKDPDVEEEGTEDQHSEGDETREGGESSDEEALRR